MYSETNNPVNIAGLSKFKNIDMKYTGSFKRHLHHLATLLLSIFTMSLFITAYAHNYDDPITPNNTYLPITVKLPLLPVFFIDSINGLDINSGKTQQAPWKSFAHLKDTEILPPSRGRPPEAGERRRQPNHHALTRCHAPGSSGSAGRTGRPATGRGARIAVPGCGTRT